MIHCVDKALYSQLFLKQNEKTDDTSQAWLSFLIATICIALHLSYSKTIS